MGRKRKSGEGTVRLRKDGRWEGRVVVGYDDKGLPKTKNVLAKTKGECVEKLNVLKNSVTPTATVKVRADMPFGEWVEFWYENYSKPMLRPSSRRSYEDFIRLYICPQLGSVPLNKLTMNDLQRFFHWMRKDGRTLHPTEKLGWRDLVLLSVMYSSGARAQEICSLTVKDVMHDEKGNAILALTGKGEKSRRVKITMDATQLLDKYITYRRIRDQPDRYVFPSQRNACLSVPAIEEIFTKYITMAKAAHPDKFCSGPYTPHVMRHTTATHLIEAGVPLAVVKNILGHSSIQTTQIYLNISQQTVDRSMEKWNKKWFAKNSPDESALLQEKKSIPDFLW